MSNDRFYRPPAVRRHQESRVDSSDAEARTDSEESTLSRPNSVSLPSSSSSSFSSLDASSSNLERIIESVTPFVNAQIFYDARGIGWGGQEAFFCLGDLWEAYKEWSAYGVGVPLLLNGCDLVKQYYVPYLSGIQLYVDQQTLSHAGSGNYWEAERWANSAVFNRGQGRPNLPNLNAHLLSPSNYETEVYNLQGKPVYEYIARGTPYDRKPLYDQILSLASKFPALNVYRSCDISPNSWLAVAWYPIYRIPVGPTLQNLVASFLTFHPLSMRSPGKNQPQLHVVRCPRNGDTLKISLPIFGLGSYKLKDSIFLTGDLEEGRQATTLHLGAQNWLQYLGVKLDDWEFFQSHNVRRG